MRTKKRNKYVWGSIIQEFLFLSKLSSCLLNFIDKAIKINYLTLWCLWWQKIYTHWNIVNSIDKFVITEKHLIKMSWGNWINEWEDKYHQTWRSDIIDNLWRWKIWFQIIILVGNILIKYMSSWCMRIHKFHT